MGCSCLGPGIKIKSNINTVSNQLYIQKKKEKIPENTKEENLENLLKSYKTKINTECSNISSSRISLSDDVQGDEKRNSENKN